MIGSRCSVTKMAGYAYDAPFGLGKERRREDDSRANKQMRQQHQTRDKHAHLLFVLPRHPAVVSSAAQRMYGVRARPTRLDLASVRYGMFPSRDRLQNWEIFTYFVARHQRNSTNPGSVGAIPPIKRSLNQLVSSPNTSPLVPIQGAIVRRNLCRSLVITLGGSRHETWRLSLLLWLRLDSSHSYWSLSRHGAVLRVRLLRSTATFFSCAVPGLYASG
jgi:hypothetical protein